MSRTPRTPRSRTPSRAGTPIPGAIASRLVPPSLHSAPSVSSLQVFSHGAPSTSPTPVSGSPPSRQSEMNSSASSVQNMPAGILVHEPDTEVETIDGEQGTVAGHMESNASDEQAKQNLREHLRRTLTDQETSGESMHQFTSHKGQAAEMDQVPTSSEPYKPRQYFVLTDAGKPVFISSQHGEDSDILTSTIGLMQALISVFLDDGDKLRCINAGNARITFLLRSPLYYACVSSWREPESVTRFHLEYLHLQILSVVSAEQLRRMFERRTNFDLRRLLSGAEPFLHSLLSRLEWDLAMSTSSLFCLKLDPNLRKSIADALVPTSKIKDVLYMILVAQGRVVTLVRPRKHSIHPSDLHVLINTIYAPSIINSSASASWLPICLPKFNSLAFVNAYVMFLRRNDEDIQSPPSTATSESTSAPSSPAPSIIVSDHGRPPSTPGPDIGLVCVSGAADFEAVRNWCNVVSEKLERDGLMTAMVDAIIKGRTTYSVSDLSIPGLRHFMYKSRSHVQITMPEFEDPYDDLNERRRLITLYQTLHDAIHAKSGQGSTLKLQYIRTERESVMGWITQPFEIYMALSPLIPKSAAVNAANAVSRWVQKEEKRLFLRDAPVF